MTTSPYVITEINAEQARLAASIVLGTPEASTSQTRWDRVSPYLSPTDLLLLWNDALGDMLKVAGPAAILLRIKLMSDKSVRFECRSFTVSSDEAKHKPYRLN